MSEPQPTTLTDTQLTVVSNRIVRFADVLNSTGVYTFLKEQGALDKAKDALGRIVTGAVEKNINARFHDGLGFFEKLGFLSDRKYQAHCRKVALAKGISEFFVGGAVDVLPQIVDHVHRSREFEKLTDFFIGGMAFVNREPTIAVQRRVIQLYESNERRYDATSFGLAFRERAAGRVGLLSPVPSSLSERREALYVSMLAGCDLRDPDVLVRARELGDFMRLSAEEVEQHVRVVLDGGEATSELTGFSAICISNVFRDLMGNVERAKQAAVYVVENDPYQAVRQQRREAVVAGGIALAGAVAIAGGPLGQAVIGEAAPLISALATGGPTVGVVIEVSKRLLALKNNASLVQAQA